MSIALGWQVTTTSAAWLQEAIKAARNRRQLRFAHMVENAGIIIVGLRSIDREFRALFLPLQYFDPQEWPEDKRNEWAGRIVTLASEDDLVPRMRIADRALETLVNEEKNPDVRSYLNQIRFVSELTKGRSSIGDLLTDTIIHADFQLEGFVPDIIGALCRKDPAIERIDFIARSVLEESHLRALAGSAEEAFGYLLGRQQRTFPALPAPSWVWEL